MSSSSARHLPSALLFALCAFIAGPAQAGDTWSTPFPGVRLLVRNTNAPNRIRALEVSLCHVGVKVRATRPSERGQTVGAFAQAIGAQFAINGDLFSAGFVPSGMAVGRGQWWGDPDNSWEGLVAFGVDQVDLRPVRQVLDAPLPWMTDLVSGRPQLLGDGQRVEIPAGVQAFCGSRAPRSAVGFSRDGSKLYLAVVDRTPRDTGTTSRGMTCTEMADLMKGLGAWEAMNLDGGGSSQLWVRGKGYVNDPSGNNHGAGLRVVANHLAIFASGLGNPGSCPLDINPLEDPEPERDFPPLPGTQGPIDLDGDGKADTCVRGPTGVSCARGQPGGLGPAFAGPALSDASGWSDLTNLPLVFGDLDGDGRTDLCARANAGVRCWKAIASGGAITFGPAIVGPPYSDASGFSARQYHSTLRMADVDGDGRSDICIRTASRFRCDLSTGDGFGAQVVTTAISNATGFSAQNAFGTLQMGDLDGDGKADVCARSPSKGMLCWKSNGTAFATEAAAIQGPDWTDAGGWGAAKYWRTIRMADVDGDGKADLCARTAKDFRCYRSTGKGFGRAIIGPKLSNANGWGDATNYETIRLADVDGDGDLDLCARGDAGVTCWPFTGLGFGAPIGSTWYSDGAGWAKERFYSTMRLADLDGDGRVDLCARASAGLRCHLGLAPNGAPFGPTLNGPAWSDATGFDTLATYGTLAMEPLPPALGALVADLDDPAPEPTPDPPPPEDPNDPGPGEPDPTDPDTAAEAAPDTAEAAPDNAEEHVPDTAEEPVPDASDSASEDAEAPMDATADAAEPPAPDAAPDVADPDDSSDLAPDASPDALDTRGTADAATPSSDTDLADASPPAAGRASDGCTTGPIGPFHLLVLAFAAGRRATRRRQAAR